MSLDFEQLLDRDRQTALADEIVTMAAAVASNASAPDFAMRALEQGVLKTLSAEQRGAAMALQAYGARCAKEVFTAALDTTATERADTFSATLENESPEGARAMLDEQPESGMEFKSRMCRAIAGKCAELAAADIERVKKGKITILNEEDQQVFDQQHAQREQEQAQAVTTFLSSLPRRYPPFGIQLFKDIRQSVQHDIEERYKNPDIHARVKSIFQEALEAMPSDARSQAG